VNRYVFACEVWLSKSPGLFPSDDPDQGAAAAQTATAEGEWWRAPMSNMIDQKLASLCIQSARHQSSKDEP
jgi:hypothetical protein